ncbi:lipid IV(A) 3-deoxy-D-manno-octulosonic acid transferase [Methylotenera versatilis]|uniref:3-deoxy-D-manno-octulosonic acid transferase n=1 Tax=Methylotenera versatilis (strain 301) TaxID=666681 RepID=D7DP48_METV0|nr:lipid IV(A) 3-deoxy-D-manno-octulosonic acid transferase [Methylotenera versatilis]ADI31079.1 Three-deoxy-D-manno-octulosonic-acid transferase domain protein [Methylotenera versatilis 301]
MNRFFYSLLLYLVLPFVPLKLLWRGIKQAEYRQHWLERFGFYTLAVKKPVIWLHCVSVGETRAAAPLINALLSQYPNHQLLLTHTTPTGRATSEQLFGDKVMRVYLPYDLPFAVKGFLTHFKPALGMLMETELWFNLIAGAKARNIPLLLINARLSEKSALGYRKLSSLVHEGLQNLSAIASQTEQDAERLIQLGAANVSVVGNLKFEVHPPEDAAMRGKQLRDLFGSNRPLFLAASTREGEESIILDAVTALKLPHLLTVIVPRHPQRFNEVEALLQQRQLTYQRRSTLVQTANADTRFILGDSMGELFSYYASADICLVGGSVLPFGGQNLIEAMRMAKPVLIGEHTFNFTEVSERAIAQNAAWRVKDIKEMQQAIQTLLDNPQQQLEMGQAGLALCMASQGATQKTLAIIAAYV